MIDFARESPDGKDEGGPVDFPLFRRPGKLRAWGEPAAPARQRTSASAIGFLTSAGRRSILQQLNGESLHEAIV